jgi:hypothetical protein
MVLVPSIFWVPALALALSLAWLLHNALVPALAWLLHLAGRIGFPVLIPFQVSSLALAGAARARDCHG